MRGLSFAKLAHCLLRLKIILDKSFVSENQSDYAIPIVLVPKSTGSIRVCAEYIVTLNNDIKFTLMKYLF